MIFKFKEISLKGRGVNFFPISTFRGVSSLIMNIIILKDNTNIM